MTHHICRLHHTIACLSVIVVLFGGTLNTAFAQQTIVNLPSADQTKAGHLFVLHETQVRPWEPEGYWRSTNFITYGVTDWLELCTTFYNIDLLGRNKPYTAVGFGYKMAHQLFREQADEWEIKWTWGQMLTTSFDGLGTGLWTYTHASTRLPVLQTRIAAGLSMGSRQVFGGVSEAFISSEHINFIGSIEQPITKELGFVMEWFSGTHEMADLVPGIIYHDKKTELVLILGYKFANYGGGTSNGIIFEIGKTF